MQNEHAEQSLDTIFCDVCSVEQLQSGVLTGSCRTNGTCKSFSCGLHLYYSGFGKRLREVTWSKNKLHPFLRLHADAVRHWLVGFIIKTLRGFDSFDSSSVWGTQWLSIPLLTYCNLSPMAPPIHTHCFTALCCLGLCLKLNTKNGVRNLQITSRTLQHRGTIHLLVNTFSPLFVVKM